MSTEIMSNDKTSAAPFVVNTETDEILSDVVKSTEDDAESETEADENTAEETEAEVSADAESTESTEDDADAATE